jgi:hypothetical protein
MYKLETDNSKMREDNFTADLPLSEHEKLVEIAARQLIQMIKRSNSSRRAVKESELRLMQCERKHASNHAFPNNTDTGPGSESSAFGSRSIAVQNEDGVNSLSFSTFRQDYDAWNDDDSTLNWCNKHLRVEDIPQLPLPLTINDLGGAQSCSRGRGEEKGLTQYSQANKTPCSSCPSTPVFQQMCFEDTLPCPN